MNTGNYIFKNKLGSAFLFCACDVHANCIITLQLKQKNRGKYTGFPHTASHKNAAHTLHINQTSVLTCH